MQGIFHQAIALSLLVLSQNLFANDDSPFSTGPVFEQFGENAQVDGGLLNPKDQRFKVVFDVAKSNDPGKLNSHFNSVARFINMHVRAGVPQENIEVALVVHGKATFDLLKPDVFTSKFDNANANSALLRDLIAQGVSIYLCGQSAHHLEVNPKDVIEDVQISLSAMTANALLQQQGYTLNPL